MNSYGSLKPKKTVAGSLRLFPDREFPYVLINSRCTFQTVVSTILKGV